VVINEIAYHPMRDPEERGEYLELFNRSDRAIDLTGFRFTDGIEFAFPAGTAIGPGAFLVIARDPGHLRVEYGIDNALGPYDGRLDDDGERIELTDPLGNPADEVEYRDADPWPIWADGLGSSLELRDPRADNASPLAWEASDESRRSEWRTFSHEGIFPGGDTEFHLFLLGPGECLVDDIRIERGGAGHIANGSFEQGEAGWSFGGTHRESRVTTEDAAAGARSLHLIATRRGDSLTNHIECETNPPIRSGESYRITLRARWLKGFDLLLARTYNHGIARTHRLDVPGLRGTLSSRVRTGGSAGGPNTILAENIGPTVRDVSQDPPAPAANLPVRIRARIGDPDGIAAAEIVWRRDRSTAAGRVPLADRGGGAFEGEIPGQPSRAIIEYWIEARDGRGEGSTWPREAADRPLLFQVDLPATPGAIPSYHLIVSDRVRQEILSGDPWSNALLNAAFVIDRRRIFHNVGVRQRGCACSRGKIHPPLLRLRFREDQRFAGRPSINLDNQHADPPIQRDRAMSRILQVMGLPYSRHRYVRFHINGTFQKIYEDIERVDRLFIDRFWPADRIGDLYKVDGWFELPDAGNYTWQPASLIDFGDDPEAYRFRFKNRGDEILDDYAPLIELARRFDPRRTDDKTFDALVETSIAVDEWLRAIAVRTAADAWDTFGVLAGKNAYIYRPLPESPFFYIPFDNDATFGIGPFDVRRPLVTSAMPEIRRFVTRPQHVRRYYAIFQELLDGPFSRGFLEPFFRENYDVLRSEGPATWPADVLSFLDARREYIASQLPAAEFRIVTNGGRPVETGADRISIIGDAPLRAARFRLNDGPVELEFVSASRWKISLPLRPGENVFRFEAFDADGRSIGEATAIVRSTRPAGFIRGDTNRDGRVDLADAIAILAGLFSGGPLPCPDAADIDDDGRLLIGDAVTLLQYLFAGGANPAPPFPDAGLDPTDDGLGCDG